MTNTNTTASAISRILSEMNYEPKQDRDGVGYSVYTNEDGDVEIVHKGYDHGQPDSTLLEELRAKKYDASLLTGWKERTSGTNNIYRVEIIGVYGKVVA
jgi:hypothetical protein